MAVIHDLLVIGGGINGAGIARDATGRGLSVLLCEQADLAAATSSASTKLIHGGLRYLEHWEFRLVREALIEREVLLAAAPHIIWPLRFVLPHDKSLRPAWLIRLGLFLYDHLGGRRRLPGTETWRLSTHPAGRPLRAGLDRAFVYSDCWVEDSRLVVLNAMDATARGATIRTRTKLVRATRTDGVWQAWLQPEGGAEEEVRARALVNAAGPWVDDVLAHGLRRNARRRVRLVKGSHVVVARIHDGDHAYILQNTDRRIVFVIPYEQRFSLIGTTDLAYEGDPAAARIGEDEVRYLLDAVNRWLARPLSEQDVVWAYSGVRPLFDDSEVDVSAITRDYVLDLEAGPGEAPLLSVFGGKITTYRCLAEHALARLAPKLGIDADPWTAHAPLPGGDIENADFERFLQGVMRDRPFLPDALARRLARAYGTMTGAILGSASRLEDMGADLGAGLHEAELDHLMRSEWAQSADDVLWRRSKLGLHVPDGAAARIDDWMAQAR